MRLRALAAGALALGLAAAPACSGGSGGSGGEGGVTVFAAASLTKALDGGPQARLSFAGSQQLAAQVEAGARADVVVFADRPTMDRLGGKHLVDPPVVVAANSMAIAVRKGNPKHVTLLADLAGLQVVLADPSVPAGRYAAQVLGRAGVAVKPVSLELDVESAAQKVALGQADAAIVYATDVHDRRDLDGVIIPEAVNVRVEYLAAVVASSHSKPQARSYIASLPRRLAAAGFGAP